VIVDKIEAFEGMYIRLFMKSGIRGGLKVSHRVSIIINANSREQKYLIRCINSIQRQLYENKESIIWSEDKMIEEYVGINVPVMNTEALRNYISKAESEWLLFCNSDSVLAPDVLESLIRKVEVKDCVPAAKYLMRENEDFIEEANVLAKYSPYGKLFNISNILCLRNKEDMRMNTLFTLQYLGFFGVGLESVDSYIYDSTEEMGITDVDEILDLSHKLRTEYRHRFDLNVGFAEGCLVRLLKEAVEKHENEYYQIIKQYINAIADEDEKLLPFILDAVHISPEQYQYVRDYSLDEYIFYRDRLTMLEQNRSDYRNMESMDGYDLAQNTVALYRDGRLGLKTIVASLLGWIKYKVKGKEVR